MIKRSVIFLFMLSAALPAQDLFDPDQEQRPTGIPAFDLLPNGSILRKVALPQYRQDNTLKHLVKINQLTIVSDAELDGRDVEIELYDEAGELESTSTIAFANLNKKTQIIRTVDDFRFDRKDFSVRSAGLLYNMGTRRGILFGPVKTIFKKSNSIVYKTPKSSPALAVMLSFAFSPHTLLAEPSAASADEIANLEQKAKPAKELGFEEPTSSIIERSKKEADKADKAVSKFLKKSGLSKQGENSIKKSDVENTSTVTSDTTKTPAAEKPASTKKKTSITATCEGGMFFDSEKGLFVYRKNIQLSDPTFTMNCDDELKIFLNPKKKKDTKAKSADAPEFNDLKEAIATGNVIVRIKDTKKGGPDIIAKAKEAIFDGRSKSFILSKGFPSVRQGNNSVKALKEGLTIRITEAGVAMDSFGDGNNWETKIDVPE